MESLFFQNLLGKKHLEAIALSQLDEPIRAELFSGERLEQHAESLALAQRVTTNPRKGRPLLARVLDNGRVLLDLSCNCPGNSGGARHHTCGGVAGRQLPYRGRTLREIHDDLPSGYYRELPKLAEGHSRVIRASLAWPGRLSPIRTAALTRKCFAGSCALTSVCTVDHWRALGGRDYFARGARGESPAPGGAYRA